MSWYSTLKEEFESSKFLLEVYKQKIEELEEKNYKLENKNKNQKKYIEYLQSKNTGNTNHIISCKSKYNFNEN